MAMAANKGLISVKFLKQWSGYNQGDIAGFHQSRADSLVKSGMAALYTPESVTKAYTGQTHTSKKVYGNPTEELSGPPAVTPKPRKKHTRKPRKRTKQVTPQTADDTFIGELSEPITIEE